MSDWGSEAAGSQWGVEPKGAPPSGCSPYRQPSPVTQEAGATPNREGGKVAQAQELPSALTPAGCLQVARDTAPFVSASFIPRLSELD